MIKPNTLKIEDVFITGILRGKTKIKVEDKMFRTLYSANDEYTMRVFTQILNNTEKRMRGYWLDIAQKGRISIPFVELPA